MIWLYGYFILQYDFINTFIQSKIVDIKKIIIYCTDAKSVPIAQNGFGTES